MKYGCVVHCFTDLAKSSSCACAGSRVSVTICCAGSATAANRSAALIRNFRMMRDDSRPLSPESRVLSRESRVPSADGVLSYSHARLEPAVVAVLGAGGDAAPRARALDRLVRLGHRLRQPHPELRNEAIRHFDLHRSVLQVGPSV